MLFFDLLQVFLNKMILVRNHQYDNYHFPPVINKIIYHYFLKLFTNKKKQ